jgi:hypothetical protein
MTSTESISQKKIVIFDLDGTLAKSKSKLDKEMATLICELLRKKYVAVTSGGSIQQFETQFLSKLPKKTNLRNLFLFPTSAATGYYYDVKHGHFSQAYAKLMSEQAVGRIIHSFEIVFKEIGYIQPKKTYGRVFENRGSQLTFSALGQKAPLRIKQKWDPKQEKRLKIRRHLKRHLHNLEITIGGTTSIDVTKKGVNKTLCVKKLKGLLNIERKNMLYVGDALFRGGNDYVMKSTGIRCISVSGPEETKALIRKTIQN